MDKLTSLLTVFAALSVAVERVIEILKGMIPALADQKSDAKHEKARCALLHFFSAIVGALIAWAGNIDVFQRISNTEQQSWNVYLSYLVSGLLAAGGSAFWNHTLDIVKASKIQSESGAQLKAKEAGNASLIPM